MHIVKQDKEYMEREIQDFLNGHPVFKDYLERNGFRLYFCDQTGEIYVTDGKDVDLLLRLFIAIYNTHGKAV